MWGIHSDECEVPFLFRGKLILQFPYSNFTLTKKFTCIIRGINNTFAPAETEDISTVRVKQAIAADIDPSLMLSVAITESRCRPRASGGSGEYGLMQVMPGTGRGIARQLGYKNYNPDDMLDYRQNIQLAAFHLKKLTRHFGGNYQLGLLAYNKGTSGAKCWLKTHTLGSSGYVAKVVKT